jgi:hypothetical protein
MFTKPIYVTMESIASAKVILRELLPSVKSTHRAEAVARCLGFRTHATLIALLKTEDRRVVQFAPDSFVKFLRDRGQEVSLRVAYKLLAHSAILNVLEINHKISTWGYGFGQPQRTKGGKYETPTEKYQRFQRDQNELKSAAITESFMMCLPLLAEMNATKTIRRGTGSYTLKHIAERMPIFLLGDEPWTQNYVSNGTLIAAALYMGFKFKSYKDDLGYDHINVDFNMSKAIVDAVNIRVRPDSGRAQDAMRQTIKFQLGNYV